MGKFKYLPEVIAMSYLEYLFILFVLVKIVSKYYPVFEAKRWFMFELRTFESCATSVHGDVGSKILCLTRLLFFAFFLGVAVIYKFSKHDYSTGWHYFTNWNIFLITAYFLEAFLSSLLLIVAKRRNYDIWISDSMQKFLGTFLSVHFAVAGGSAIFITTVNFAVLNPHFELFNAVSHFATSVALLVDLAMNNIHVHYLEFIFNLTWAAVWLSFIWPVVATDTRGWPYDFLETDSAKCFVWYNIMFVFNFFFYNIWWALSKAKFKILGKDAPECDDFDTILGKAANSPYSSYDSYSYMALDGANR